MLGMYTDLDVLDMYMMDVEMDMDMMDISMLDMYMMDMEMEMEMDQECLSLFLRRPLGRLYRVPLFLLHLLLLLLLRTLS